MHASQQARLFLAYPQMSHTSVFLTYGWVNPQSLASHSDRDLQMPEFSSVHTLSVSSEPITSIAFNSNGDWLALGCSALGQLLVWEWRSETYVLKQQGHYYDISCLAYSPDGAYIASGAEDAKVS